MSDDFYGPPKMIKLSIAAVRQFGEGSMSGTTAPIAVYAATQMPIFNATDAHNAALKVRSDLEGKESEYNRLSSIFCAARAAILATPAPHAAALAFKLKCLATWRRRPCHTA